MRYLLPRHCRSLTHAGRRISPAADGTVEIDDATARELLPHGLQPAPETASKRDGTGDHRTVQHKSSDHKVSDHTSSGDNSSAHRHDGRNPHDRGRIRPNENRPGDPRRSERRP